MAHLRLKCAAAAAALIAGFFGITPVFSAPDTQGVWQRVTNLPFNPPHMHLLPNGKVMMWPGSDRNGNDPRIWDPATQVVTPLSKPGFNLFCSGHTFLADGRLFVAGGHINVLEGEALARIYDPGTNAWINLADMNAGRWYPTTTLLPNGHVLAIAGYIDETIGPNMLAQVFNVATNTWRNLTNALMSMQNYPRMHVAPNGKVFKSGSERITRYLDTSGTGAWTDVATQAGPARTYGSSVMYTPGKIIVMGGADPPVGTAEVIDLNQASPSWRSVGSLTTARRQINAVLLPDGKVLVTGGTSGPGFNNANTPVFASELWDPATEQWTVMDSATIPRLYHSVALLLPDGRVLMSGGDGHPEAEIYSPPYLFKGARPTITSAPANIGYGDSFFVETNDAAAIKKVRMIKLTSVTHAFNTGQHPAEPAFSQAAGGLNVTAPANGNLAPPGHYLLFIVNGNGVPSVGKVIQISANAPPPPPPPTLSSLSPNSATAGGPPFTLTVNGSNFISGTSVVRWNGANRTTGFLNATQLTAQIPASDITSTGSAQVTVANGGTISNSLTFAITANSAAPTLSSLSPSSATAGGPMFTLTVNGSNFVSTSVVRWNGVNRTTAFVNATQLTATIPASDIAAAGSAQVTVANGSDISNALTFTIRSSTSALALTSISPSSAIAGGPALTLTLNGSNFISGTSVMRWKGANRATTFVSSTQLFAAISAADIAAEGTALISVANGGTISNSLTFTITPNSPGPTLTSMSPASATAGGAAFTLTVNGGNFVNGSTVRYKGANRTTTFVNATQLSAAIPAADIATVGTAQVTVVNPNGAVTSALTFTITSASATLKSLSPASASAGATGFTLTVNGNGFVNGTSIVRWKGANRTTTFVSSTQLKAMIPASDLAAAGTAAVTVAKGGVVSNTLTFTITPTSPAPTATSIAPSSAKAGGPDFTLTVTGANFANGSIVRYKGANRTTIFVNATTLTAAIPATDITAAGISRITVANPNGTVSNGLTFTVTPP